MTCVMANNGFSTFYHDLGLDLIVEQLLFLVVEQLLYPILHSSHVFKEFFGGGRGDAYTFS